MREAESTDVVCDGLTLGVAPGRTPRATLERSTPSMRHEQSAYGVHPAQRERAAPLAVNHLLQPQG